MRVKECNSPHAPLIRGLVLGINKSMVTFRYEVTNDWLAFQLVELVEVHARSERKPCSRSRLQETDNPLGINTFKFKSVQFVV